MSATTIRRIRATPVTVPLEAPLRHSNGAHWGRFVRTVVEVETADGYVGLGEMGGGGEDATRAFAALEGYLSGHDVFALEAMRLKICNPTASLYNNRTQLHAALEFACLDIIGRKLGVPVCDLLGGRLNDRVAFASYLFFRYADPQTGRGEVRTPDQLVAHARELKAKHGFGSHKLKGGVFPPAHELECYRALAQALPGEGLRYDPNGALSFDDAVHFGRAIEDLRNDYYEDPVYGIAPMKALRDFVRIPLATNTIVVNFEQLAANAASRAVDVILLDTTFWGGIRPCVRLTGRGDVVAALAVGEHALAGGSPAAALGGKLPDQGVGEGALGRPHAGRRLTEAAGMAVARQSDVAVDAGPATGIEVRLRQRHVGLGFARRGEIQQQGGQRMGVRRGRELDLTARRQGAIARHQTAQGLGHHL